MTSEEFEARLLLLGFSNDYWCHSDAEWTSRSLGIEINHKKIGNRFSVDAIAARQWSDPLHADAAYRRLLELMEDPNVTPWEGT